MGLALHRLNFDGVDEHELVVHAALSIDLISKIQQDNVTTVYADEIIVRGIVCTNRINGCETKLSVLEPLAAIARPGRAHGLVITTENCIDDIEYAYRHLIAVQSKST